MQRHACLDFFVSSEKESAPDEGVFYVCQRCGNCCRWPGEVPVGRRELKGIAAHLEIPVDELIENYTKLRLNRAGLTLTEHDDGSCIFLEKGACKVHEAKPDQCRGFPNTWNFPGWEKVCEAIPVPLSELENPPAGAPASSHDGQADPQ